MNLYPVILLILCLTNVIFAISIISKSSWGGRDAKEKIDLKLNLSYVVIHHSAGSFCSTEKTCSAQMRNIQSYHMDDLGWDDIGYNFAIGGDNNIYEGCGAGVMGAHALSWNSKSYGIMFIGNYNDRLPSDTQIEKAKELINWLVAEGYVTSNYTVHGHRQVRATECPGNMLYEEIKKWNNWKESTGVKVSRV
ncbi:peptidoglycan-recognition protein SC2-like [Cochliomyia hominivorax]